MLILIPLGGLGTRFKKCGYKLPKPLINVMGKPIIYWLIDNLKISDSDTILIPYNSELTKYRFEDVLQKKYPKYKFKFLQLNYDTNGASETISLILKNLDFEDQPIICLDGDNFYTCDIINKWKQCQNYNQIFTFNDTSNEPIYSYIKLDNNNNINEIKEKIKISDNACTGAYAFKSYLELLHYCDYIIQNNIKQKGEYYTSTVISEMIKNLSKFSNTIIDLNDYICLGTPLHVRLFCNNFPRINALNNSQMLKKQRYCFDLDNTLVTFPRVEGDYTTVYPIDQNINFLKYLKKLGHEIIIYTARNMKSNSGNVGKCMNKIGKITFDTLDKFNVPYDEIYFGKPYADYYIDDLAISSFEDLEKELGYYSSQIEPRSFNNLDSISIQIYKKSSSNVLDGEIYYYNNIPNDIKDMFPIMFNYDKTNFKWYEMEKINGIPITQLLLSEELSTDLLSHIMRSLHRIHTSSKNIPEINVYGNYVNKLENRHSNYDYSLYVNSEHVYDIIKNDLINYEKDSEAIIGPIHGDPVLTNILVNQFGKIKFIDMRGKIDNKLTIYGDIFYDYAKLYQSLIGYDEILEGKKVNLTYKDLLINTFNSVFLDKYSVKQLENVKKITKSLLFTLIPLHHNDKCYDYYNLINSNYLI